MKSSDFHQFLSTVVVARDRRRGSVPRSADARSSDHGQPGPAAEVTACFSLIQRMRFGRRFVEVLLGY